MKKKTVSFILAVLMSICALPLTVFAEEIARAVEENAPPVVSVSSLYSYDGGLPAEFRALPDNEGNFYLDIALSKVPRDEESIVVYYRTVDDSAVAKWGDYESVGALEEACVTLSKTNGYKARVVVRSTVIDHGFVTPDFNGNVREDKIITRRFLFDLTRVVGNAELHTPRSANERNQSELYCYLRAKNYSYQSNDAKVNASAWQSNMRSVFLAQKEELLNYYWENDPSFSPQHMTQFWEEVNKIWETGTERVAYDTFYYSTDPASSINTPQIHYKGSHSDSVNVKFADEWRNYVASDVCDLGISINGTVTAKFWDSTGDATFHLYYNYQGEKRLALTLYLQGEFDDSKFFGWEHAFEYAIEGLESNNRDDHMDENFIGFTLYDNDGNVAYEVKAQSRSEIDEARLCGDLKNTINDNYAVELMAEYNEKTTYNDNFTAYYLRLPSDFALADSYSYEFISDSTDEDEIRWLENVKLSFALMCNEEPMIAKDAKGNQMVSTNFDTIKAGDPLRMSVRFDRPVYVYDPNKTFCITADIYNDRGVCLAKGLQLKLKQLDYPLNHNTYYYYAWDTLVFECVLPAGIAENKVASLRNIKISETGGTVEGFFTGLDLLGKTIRDIYVERDFRTPIATVSTQSTATWSKSRSVDVYLNTESNGRFNDYATVYYQWCSVQEAPATYSSKVTFHTNADGEIMKTIIGTGNGEMYLYLQAVSAYGKTSVSGPFGPYKFDNVAPSMSAGYKSVTGSMRARTITVDVPADSCGVRTMELYYVPHDSETGAGVRLTSFEISRSDPESELTYEITHEMVRVGVDADGEVVSDRQEIEFYWRVADNLGNVSEKVGVFKLIFDTNDYLDSNDVIAEPYGDFKGLSQVLQDFEDTYIYDYSTVAAEGPYYGFSFKVDRTKFASKSEGEEVASDKGVYAIGVTYKGAPLNAAKYECTAIDDNGLIAVLFKQPLESGKYEFRLSRRENGSTRVSKVYTVYATNGEEDNTPAKSKVENGTLLGNTVYQLSVEHPYFYYKDADGAIQRVYYNGTRQPASFSSLEKAKEYVYYKELGDIYLVQLTAATASALVSGTTGYLIAKGETVVPQAGQYWIRYKSETWTPTSGESAWVYYYYGMNAELFEGALSINLQAALNAVANRIAGYGKSVVLTDTSLFLGSAMGDKMLDRYGMPYLAPEQIHSVDELSDRTMCGNVWGSRVGFAADRNIYKSSVRVGTEGVSGYREYPIIGYFALSESSIFQYMTYGEYNGANAEWNVLSVKKGEGFVDVLHASGVYYIREISENGVSIFPIYVDKSAPDVTFSQTDDNGNLKEIPVDGEEVLDIRTKDLYIGRIADTECDRLSYVAVYKVSNLALVGVYTAEELASSAVKLEDGNYYLVVSDRSGNHYTVTAKVSSTDLSCNIQESADRFIRLTCNRRSDQIVSYEVYLNGELVTSTYAVDQTFDKAGLYRVYIRDIYGNEFSKEHLFVRNYPTVTWKYYGADGMYHAYDPRDTAANGFILTWVSDNQYKISTSVKTRFSFSGDYEFEFIGAAPVFTKTMGTETMVTIEAGQSFTLKVYYRNHKDCYSIYSGVVDVTPPSINVSAEVDVLQNGEYDLFDAWIKNGSVGDVIEPEDLYYILSEIAHRTVPNGGSVNSDAIQIDASDANDLSLVEVYLDGELIEKQDAKSGFAQISVSRQGKYRIVAKDGLGNVSEFTFTNGTPDEFDYCVDGAEKELPLHGYLNFETVGGRHVYTKVDYGKTDFKLDLKQNADVFLSVGVSGGLTEIYGFRISDGQIYPLTYKIALDTNGNKVVKLSVGEALIDTGDEAFKIGKEYPISKTGAYAVYASLGSNKVVSIRVYAPEDPTKVVSVGARVETSGDNTVFVFAELSGKRPAVSFEGLGAQVKEDIRVNLGFTVDESAFESERVVSVSLYYSKLNDLDAGKLAGKTNIYTPNRAYDDEGFYLLIVRNRYGNETVYKIAVSRSFGITASVTFGDGYKIYYSKDYSGALYSDSEIVLDVPDEDVTIDVTLNGAAYTGYTLKKEGSTTYLVFTVAGQYLVTLTDSYGNVIVRQLEINRSAYTVADELLTGYNEKALKRSEGYTNQKLSVDRAAYEGAGIYYLAIRHGEALNVLYDAFAEKPVTADEKALINVIGSDGDGVYTLICRNRYGTVVTREIHYRGTPTLRLERTTRSKSESEVYDLGDAISRGFWSNNTLSFSTEAKTYVFTVNGSVTECPRTLMFENAVDLGSFEYEITYLDEYGFEYVFKAYLVRKNVTADVPPSIAGMEIDGVFNTKQDISITFGENIDATYTRNNGEEVIYRSGEVLKKDGTYRFTVIDYAGNAMTMTIKKDTAVEFSLVDAVNGNAIPSGSVVNSSRVDFNVLNKDSAYIESVIRNGVIQTDFTDTKFTEDGKWELILCDKLGNRAYFSFYIVTRAQNGFAYTTPYEYRITEMWYDGGDGVKISCMDFVNHTETASSFEFKENGRYTVVMTSHVTGKTVSFEFTVNTTAPEVSLVGCRNGETTINDVTLSGYKVGDRIRIYRATKTGEELVEEVEITSLATKIPTITEGGKYRIVVESEAGVQTELSLVRKHVMNTAGSIFIMVVIGLSVIGLFTGLVYRNKSKTDD